MFIDVIVSYLVVIHFRRLKLYVEGSYMDYLSCSSSKFLRVLFVFFRHVLESDNMKKFFEYIQLPNFEIASDAVATFKVCLWYDISNFPSQNLTHFTINFFFLLIKLFIVLILLLLNEFFQFHTILFKNFG